MLFQLDIVRFIQVYVVQGAFSLFYFYIAAKILKRDTKKLNTYLSLFYIAVASSVTLNMVYAFIVSEFLVTILHFLTYFLFSYAQIFLLLFILILIKSEQVITPSVQAVTVVVFGILLCGLSFIPGGITINQSTGWKPVWSLLFFSYGLILSTIVTIPIVYYAVKIFYKFENERLRRKWKYFNTGTLAYLFVNFGTLISNTLNDSLFRTIWLILSALTLPTIYLIYYGVGKNM